MTCVIAISNVILCVVLNAVFSFTAAQEETSVLDFLSASQVHHQSDGAHTDGVSASTDYPQEKPGIQIPYTNSPLYLTQLAQTERFIYDALIKYEKELLARLDIVQRFRLDYEESVLHATERNEHLTHNPDEWTKASFISTHPLLAYRMIRRFAKHLQTFNEHIWQSLENELWESLESWRGNFAWPTDVDLVVAAKSVMRLQDIYDFDIHQFADGVIRDKYYGVGLTAQQCLELSQLALGQNDLQAATEWFQAAHAKVVNAEEKSVTMDELTEVWEQTYKAFQTVWPVQHFKTHDVFSEARALLRQEFNTLKVNRTFEHRTINFKSLCRGDILKTNAEISKLVCYIDNSRNPYWYVNPLRIEVNNWRPLVYQVHNFLGRNAIADISDSTVSSMSFMAETGQAAYQPTEANSFTHTWVSDEASLALYTLSRKIELLTGLHVLKYGASKAYHMSAYAVGNHYEPCVECHEPENENVLNEMGRKLTTVHAMLHEPGEGGELAFTLLGSLVKPVLGSLIIYNNLRPNGDVNQKLLHGSCPILQGQKWVATKWIYEYENFSKRPCPRK